MKGRPTACCFCSSANNLILLSKSNIGPTSTSVSKLIKKPTPKNCRVLQWKGWINSCADSICKVFNLPTNLHSLLSANSSQVQYCQQCFEFVQDLDLCLKQIQKLQRRIRWRKKQLTEVLAANRFNNSQCGSTSNVAQLISNCIFGESHRIKEEPNEHSYADDFQIPSPSPSDLIPEVKIKVIQDQEESSATCNFNNSRDLQQAANNELYQYNSAHSAGTVVGRRKASRKARKKFEEIFNDDQEQEQEQLILGLQQSIAVEIPALPLPAIKLEGDLLPLPAEKVKGNPRPKKNRFIHGDDPKDKDFIETLKEAKIPKFGAKPTAKIIEKRKKILQMMEEHPTWNSIRKRCTDFNHGNKKRWEKQIKAFEEKQAQYNPENGRPCARCVLGFKRIHVLRDHFIEFHPTQDFTCTICEQKFKDEPEIHVHELLHGELSNASASGDPIIPIACLQCNKKFPNTEQLKIHTWWHLLQDFKCRKARCQKYFTTRELLAEHNCEVNKPKTFVCEECGKAFINCYKLNRHKLSHSDAKTFKCKLCTTACKYEWSLSLHMKTVHKDGKPVLMPSDNNNSCLGDSGEDDGQDNLPKLAAAAAAAALDLTSTDTITIGTGRIPSSSTGTSNSFQQQQCGIVPAMVDFKAPEPQQEPPEIPKEFCNPDFQMLYNLHHQNQHSQLDNQQQQAQPHVSSNPTQQQMY